MFVFTLRANTLKFFSIIGIALIALISLVLFVPRYDIATTGAIQKETENIRYDKIRDNADRIEFLSQFGWECSDSAIEEVTLTIPKEFDKIINSFKHKAGTHYAASRGEYLNGIIMADYLGFAFIDAAKVIFNGANVPIAIRLAQSGDKPIEVKQVASSQPKPAEKTEVQAVEKKELETEKIVQEVVQYENVSPKNELRVETDQERIVLDLFDGKIVN